MKSKLLIGILALAFALIPGAYGNQAGISGGASSVDNGANTITNINQNAYITDNSGNHVEVSALVKNAISPIGEAHPTFDWITPSMTVGEPIPEGSPALMEYYLDTGVATADLIKCQQSASDAFGNGNKASSSIQVTSGSLNGYVGHAEAGQNGPYVFTAQSFDEAKGLQIIINEQSSIVSGDQTSATASSTTSAYGSKNPKTKEIVPAKINGYDGLAGAGLGVYDAPFMMAATSRYIDEDIDNTGIYGAKIILEDTASNVLMTAKESTKVTNGKITTPTASAFLPVSAAAIPVGTTTSFGAIVDPVFDAKGDIINLDASASNIQNPDIPMYGLYPFLYSGSASTSTKIENGEFSGINAAGCPFEGPFTAAVQAGSITGAGTLLKYQATATSILDNTVYQTSSYDNKIADPTGFSNVAGVNFLDGSIFAQPPV